MKDQSKSGPVVRIWLASVREVQGEDYRYLTRAEQDRAAKFRFEADRSRFVLSRRVLRTLLGKRLGVEPWSLPLRIGANGKPELSSSATIGFNVSHSGDWIAVALAENRRVGVDIERHRDGIDIDSIAGKHFCAAEAAIIRRSDPTSGADYFFRFWTLKEAFLKATGGGIGAGLSDFDVSDVSQPGCRTRLIEQPGGRIVTVAALQAPDGYSAAVAADGVDWNAEPEVWRWDIHE